jgi:outer membrane protein OmpA-like peptidoglycan-associated protein
VKPIRLFMLLSVVVFLVAAAWAGEPEISLDYLFGDGTIKTQKTNRGKVGVMCYPKPDPKPPCPPCPPPDPPAPPEPPGPILNKTDGNLNGVLLGLRFPINDFRLGVEYGRADQDTKNSSDDFGIMQVKAGYSLAQKERYRVEPYAGYMKLDAGGYDVASPMIGLETAYRLNRKFTLEAGGGFGINPSVEDASMDYKDGSLSEFKVKMKYQLNDDLDVGIGYRTIDFRGDGANKGDYVDGDYKLYTVGVTYRFRNKPKQLEQRPEPKPVSPRVRTVHRMLKPIFFNFDKYNLRKDQQVVLDENIRILKDHPDLLILVGGHADHWGTNEYNMKLSERRARTVAEYMVKNGIDKKRIYIFAYGEAYPYDKYNTNPHWESDRWVDLLVSEDEPTWEMGVQKRGEMMKLD